MNLSTSRLLAAKAPSLLLTLSALLLLLECLSLFRAQLTSMETAFESSFFPVPPHPALA